MLDEFLKRHGSEEGGDYFLGGTYSAAETITTPFVRRMLLVLPALRDLDVTAVLKKEGLDRLDRWFKVSATGFRPNSADAVSFVDLQVAGLMPLKMRAWNNMHGCFEVSLTFLCDVRLLFF